MKLLLIVTLKLSKSHYVSTEKNLIKNMMQNLYNLNFCFKYICIERTLSEILNLKKAAHIKIIKKKRTFLRWPITATAKTKRKTVNKEILINKKSFVHI